MEIRNHNFFNLRVILKVLLILGLPVLPCFNDLGNLPLRIWDEARQAHNAYEMYYSHHYWVPTFDGLPDNFGTKPAVFIWFEVLSMNFFGVNEFALRFPAAASAYLLGVALMFFIWHYFKSYPTALIAGILLFGSEALIRIHVARTADYDAPVAAFGTLASFSYFVFLNQNKKWFWYITCLFFALAVLMKGTAGMLLMPSLLLFTIWQKKLLGILKSWHTYVGVLLFLGLTLGYYAIRNAYQSGYAQLVFDAELKSMFFKPAQGHSAPFNFYFENFYTQWFSHYWWLLPAGIASTFFTRNLMVKKIGIFCLFQIVGYFLIISLSATKLYWYDAPLYAYVVILCASFFYLLLEQIDFSDYRRLPPIILKSVLLVSLALFGYNIIKKTVVNPQESYQEQYYYTMAKFLQQSNKADRNLNGYKILSGDAYVPHHTFYIKQMQRKGQQIDASTFDKLTVSDSVMTAETNMNELLTQKYYTTLLSTDYNIFTYRLDSLKKDEPSK